MPSLSDLLRMGKQYIGDALPGGSLNPEMQPIADLAKYIAGGIGENSPMNRDLQSWHGKTQRGLSDLIAGNEGPQADYGYAQMMNMAGVAPVGMTAWHGSPHKFDKFDASKIGTGEGAQAYGHGLYLAESPDVAQSYAQSVKANTGELVKRGAAHGLPEDVASNLAAALQSGKSFDPVLDAARKMIDNPLVPAPQRQAAQRLLDHEMPAYNAWSEWSKPGQVYKVDLPDDAIAKMLDWDKPLSQQIEHLGKLSDAELYNLGITREGLDAFTGKQLTGGDLMRFSDNQHGGGFLNKKGIPGIRYLDGGSRSAGQGSSNFVVFDPEMIRILERNGVPTGQKPWNPNEYRPLSDLMNPRID